MRSTGRQRAAQHSHDPAVRVRRRYASVGECFLRGQWRNVTCPRGQATLHPGGQCRGRTRRRPRVGGAHARRIVAQQTWPLIYVLTSPMLDMHVIGSQTCFRQQLLLAFQGRSLARPVTVATPPEPAHMCGTLEKRTYHLQHAYVSDLPRPRSRSL